jgi:hypothetical protein
MAHQINIPGTNNGEVKTFTVYDSGDPSCGLPASQYEFSGGFYFDEIEYLDNFKADLVKLLDNYGFIQGRATVETDVEHQSRLDAETENWADYQMGLDAEK